MRQKSVNRFKAFEGIPGTLVPKTKKARVSKEGFDKEADLQKICERYLNLEGLFYIRLPDSLWRSFMASNAPIYCKKEASDCLSGLPDLIVLHKGKFIAFELKSKNGKMSKKQRDVQAVIGTHEIRTFEEFKELVDEFV